MTYIRPNTKDRHVERPSRWVFLDCNLLCWAAAHTLGDMTDGDQDTGVVYGFLKRLWYFANQFHTRNFVFCWDSPSSYRREVFSDYKKGRHDREDMTEEDVALLKATLKQINQLQDKILPDMGFLNVVRQTGIESDDLIAVGVQNACVGQAIIVSSDQDLFQLLSPTTVIYNPNRRKLLNVDWFKAEFGIEPEQWALVKALSGCKSDCVPGIRGIGEKTACKYLRGELKADSIAMSSVVGGVGTVEFNLPLVKLPHEKTKPYKLHPPRFSVEGFQSVCGYFGIMSMFSRAAEWDRVFNAHHGREAVQESLL